MMRTVFSQPLGLPHFAGTGKDGRVRVLVGKSKRTHEQLKWLKTIKNAKDNIEIVGWASTKDEFTKQLEAEKPDVVVVGSYFDGSNRTSPLKVLQDYIKNLKHEKPPGIILHAVIIESLQNYFKRKNLSLAELPVHFIEDKGFVNPDQVRGSDPPSLTDEIKKFRKAMVTLIKAADPFKQVLADLP